MTAINNSETMIKFKISFILLWLCFVNSYFPHTQIHSTKPKKTHWCHLIQNNYIFSDSGVFSFFIYFVSNTTIFIDLKFVEKNGIIRNLSAAFCKYGIYLRLFQTGFF